MKFERLSEQVAKLRKKNLAADTVLILAVSMGVDSAVLLEVCQRLKVPLHVVHFNHHKRQQSEFEEKHVKMYCEARKLAYSIVDVPAISGNFQAESRSFRYQQLVTIGKQYPRFAIVTAHHFDDQVETYFYRMFTGSSVIKRGGMSTFEKREETVYFRPFLNIEKSVLYQVAGDEQITYFEDESNFETHYTRNKIRHQVLPVVEKVMPAYRKSLQNDIEEIQLLNDYFEEKWQQFLNNNVERSNQEIKIQRRAFLNEHEYVQNIILERAIRHFHFSLKRVRYTEMKKLITKGKGNLILKKKCILSAFDDVFIIGFNSGDKDQNEAYHFFLIEGCEKLPKPYKLCYNYPYSNCDDMLEIHAEDLPFLIVRNYAAADQVQIKNYHKRVQRLFIDRKLPAYKRLSYPIIEDTRTNKIIWIPNMYKSYERNEVKDKIKIYFKDDGGVYA